MGILNINAENFNIQVKDVAKEVEVNTYHGYDESYKMDWLNHEKYNSAASHVNKILSNRIARAVGKIIPGYPTGKQVREVLEEVLGVRVSVHKHKYVGESLKNMVTYDVAERGKVGMDRHGIEIRDKYKEIECWVRIYHINIIY